MSTEILEEKIIIELVKFIVEELTFFIESNPKLFTRFAWFTFCLITLNLLLSQLMPQSIQIYSQKSDVQKEIEK